MSNSGISDTEPTEALRRLKARNDVHGLFLCYAKGRARRIWARLAVGFAGAATFGILRDPGVAILVATILAVGETIDCMTLQTIACRWSLSRPPPTWAHRLATLTAAVQSTLTAGAIAIIWLGGVAGETHFFATAFLMGAAMDAGTSLRFHRPAALARLMIYVASFVLLDVHEVLGHPLGEFFNDRYGFDLVASLVLALVAFMFIRFNARAHDLRMVDGHKILGEQRRLLESRQALARKEYEARRLALVARHANDGVVIYRADGKIDWVNDTFCGITGFASEDLVGNRMEEVIPAQDLEAGAIRQLVEARRQMRPCRTEIKVHRKTGEVVWVEVNLTPILHEPGMPPIIIAVERDITEAKTREAELARARAEAEEAAQTKSRFLATMSHELRTPMNGVIGTAELLSETQLDDDQRLYVDTIVESGQALLAIINDILDLSRLQAGAPVLAREKVDLSRCIGRAVELMRPTAAAKHITLDWSPPDKTTVVMGDGGRVRQIVLNLVGNAIKFTGSGGVKVSVSTRRDGDTCDVAISVADSGIGIAKDRIQAIFESFTQADGDIGRRYGGTGLGLTISRRLAQEMDGDITVHSEKGQGSVFTARLKLDTAHEIKPSEKQAVPLHPGGDLSPLTGRTLKVLLAEDNRTNALIVQRMLESSAIDLIVASDGNAAVRMFLEEAPDIVLMDLSMPGKTGFEATREIRTLEKAAVPCPIVAFTANAFDEERQACLAAGFDGFITKPLKKDVLLQEIARLTAIIDLTGLTTSSRTEQQSGLQTPQARHA